MYRNTVAVAVALAVSLASFAAADGGKGGKAEFDEHCAVCHPDGGNPAQPKKTLKKKDLEANGVRNAKDIVKLMRNPGPGMIPFDQKKISDREAKAIADYILKTYK